MKNRPIHENLDTSYVNLSALVRYLRRRSFVGSVRVELSGYEADIVLTAENQMRVREHDRIAGRVAEGEEALQRLLIRARESGGIINVYQTLPDEPVSAQPPVIADIPKTTFSAAQPPQENFVPAAAEPQIAGIGGAPAKVLTNGARPLKPAISLPDFPFELSNNFESKARQPQMTAQEWQMLLNLIGELLQTVDTNLATANLNFTAAFQKVCAEISADYPFLNQEAGGFVYRGGTLKIADQPNAKIFVAGINESLRRILEKLSVNQKFAEIHRSTVQKILGLIHRRRPLYDKFFITPQLEKNLGA